MEYENRIIRVKNAICEAEYVLIGGGAGLSDAAGLHYDGERFQINFQPFIKKYGLTDMYSAGFYPYKAEEEKWAYWAKHILINRYEAPAGKIYKDLLKLVINKNYFVLTTNVDSQFEKAGFPKEKIFATQGNYGLLQCAKGCHDRVYDNEEMMKAMVSKTDENLKIPSDMVPKCPVCGGRMDVSVRKDIYFIQDEAWYEAATRYNEFLVQSKGKKIVLLEMGVGFNTPTIIRYPFEKMTYENKNAVLIRFNKGYPEGLRENEANTITFTEDMNKAVTDILVL